uniref:Uncharacterized protein LOC111112779 isoform X3 n=1 Tax=Crassostrea virginica TaxID=6565 RepID=A0A8B8BSH3_CRAVI|nr:uncharacterized protein LOC111112779 isoform X3 [Crassostrea virginica]
MPPRSKRRRITTQAVTAPEASGNTPHGLGLATTNPRSQPEISSSPGPILPTQAPTTYLSEEAQSQSTSSAGQPFDQSMPATSISSDTPVPVPSIHMIDTQTIWLVGSSIIKHAFLEAVLRPGGTNLTLERQNISLWWQGYSGLQLGKTTQKIRSLKNVGPVPNFILIHCGGNDLGKLSVRRIRVVAKLLLLFIRTNFQNIKVIWSFILPRLQWRTSASLKAMEKARKRVNSHIATTVLQSGGAIIRHTDIKPDPALFAQDGVHLSSLGNSIFLNSLQGDWKLSLFMGNLAFLAKGGGGMGTAVFCMPLYPHHGGGVPWTVFHSEPRPSELVA